MDIKDKIIDYLLSNGACDCCAKCIHNRPLSPKNDADPCKPFDKGGDTACRKGMIAYFKKFE